MARPGAPARPIVVLGGFLSVPGEYAGMVAALTQLTGRPVKITEVNGPEWLVVNHELGWEHVLDKLDRTVRQALAESGASKATLVGHSVGGVLSRLYLSPRGLGTHFYRGLAMVDQLITLGSAHFNLGGPTRLGFLSRYVDGRYPGAYFAPRVRYTSIIGNWLSSSHPVAATAFGHWVCQGYREMAGPEAESGDGLIPLRSANLDGSRQMVLEGVAHGMVMDPARWYGSAAIVPLWWAKED